MFKPFPKTGICFKRVNIDATPKSDSLRLDELSASVKMLNGDTRISNISHESEGAVLVALSISELTAQVSRLVDTLQHIETEKRK